jgi:hypothetical protein
LVLVLAAACGDSEPASENGPSDRLDCPQLPVVCGGPVSTISFSLFEDPGNPNAYATEAYPCVLAILRDRDAPAVVRTERDEGDSRTEWTVILDPGPTPALVQRSGFLNGVGPFADPVEACDLQASSVFQDCIDRPDLDCFDIPTWFTDCEPASPRCPEPG